MRSCPRPFSRLVVVTLVSSVSLAAPLARAQIYDPDASASKPTTHPASRPASRPAKVKPKPIERLHVLYTADLFGRFAWPGCKRAKSNLSGINADFSHFIGALRNRRAAIAASGASALTIAGGSMTRLDLLGTYTFRRDKPSRDALAMLEMARFDAVGVGLYDFGARADHLRRYLDGLLAAKIPALAANVTCAKKSDPRCKPLGVGARRYLVVERGGLKIGVFGVVREDMLAHILKRSRVGLSVEDPTKTARRIVAKLRGKHKVDLVVMIANVNLESNTPQPVVDLLRGLVKPKHRVDIVLANSMFERDGDRFVTSLRIDNGPVVVGTDRFGQTLGEMIIDYERERGSVIVKKVRVVRRDAAHYEPAKEAVPRVRRLLAGLCSVYNRVLGTAHIKGSILRVDFMRYLLEVMRKDRRAEVAILNESAIADTSFPMSGRVTAEAILRTLRSESKLGSVKVSGSRLKALLGRHLGIDGELSVLGIEKKGVAWYVNGRRLVSGDRYRVALTQFVAAGGDGLVKLRGTEPFSVGKDSLRKTVTKFFKKGGANYDGDPSINVDKDFADLEDRWLISTSMSVGFGLSNIGVFNNFDSNGTPSYDLPLLRRENVTTLSVDARIDLSATTRNHSFETQVQLQYAQAFTRAQPTADDPDPGTVNSEALDRILISASYRLRALRNAWGNKWWVPQPFAEAILISEFTGSGVYAPDPADPDTTETYHYADLSGIVGVGLQPHPLLFLKAGFVQRGELLTPDGAKPESRASRGIYLGYQLKRWKIVPNVNHPLSLESRLDFYATALTSTVRIESTLQSKIAFGLTRLISLAVAHRLYFFDNSQHPIAVANDITVLLGVVLDFRRQTF